MFSGHDAKCYFVPEKSTRIAVALFAWSNALAFGPHVCLLLMFSEGESLMASVIGVAVQALGITAGTLAAGTEAHFALRSLSLLLGGACYTSLAFPGQ